jgi:sulfotransferase 6B1
MIILNRKFLIQLLLAITPGTVSYSNNFEQKYIIISIRKCGTHLAFKCLWLAAGKPGVGTEEDQWKILSQETINKLPSNNILGAHLEPTKHNIAILLKNNFKGIFIYRDPRDYAVSFAYWIRKHPETWPMLQNISFNALLLKIISDIPKQYAYYLKWRNCPFIYSTTYERLVGPKGYGNLEDQLTEIRNMANHFGISIDEQQMNQVANQLYGGTDTFREGKIGSWKKHFTKQHIAFFKKVAGGLLIKLGYEHNLRWGD